MKTRYRYIEFVVAEPTGFSCRSKKTGDEIGVVKWYVPWRQFCYFPTVQAVYSAGCLRDIADFIESLKPGVMTWQLGQLPLDLTNEGKLTETYDEPLD